MIVRAGLLVLDDPKYAILKEQDNDISHDFGHQIHLNLCKLSNACHMLSLHEHSLKQYSSFPFRNHREFYHSVVETWQNFPVFEDKYDRETITRAVLPHITRFWVEVRNEAPEPPRVEARRIVKWIKEPGRAQRNLMLDLVDSLAGIDLAKRDLCNWSHMCFWCKCAERFQGEWSASETDRSQPY